MFENSGQGWNLPEQLAGSSSRSGRNQGAAVETDAIGEQQLKRTQSRAAAESGRKQRAAAEADANGEQQLKRIEWQSRRERSSSS